MHFFSAEQLDTNGKFTSLKAKKKRKRQARTEREREREKPKLTHPKPNNPQTCEASKCPKF